MKKPLFLMILLLVAGCGNGANGDARQLPSGTPTPAGPGQPAYGPVEDVWGRWTTGFEVSSFALCRDSSCVAASDPETCWLDGTREFFDAVRASGVRQFRAGGNPTFRVHLKGRIARNGPFGHMGAHGCQVEGQQLVLIDAWPASQ